MKRMIRRSGRIWTAVLIVCMTLSYCVPVSAASETQERTYVVRIFSGQRGLIDAKEGAGTEVWETRAKEGEQIVFRPQSRVTVTDEKYYVKGIRESGKDFREDENAIDASDSDNPSFEVKQDIDYVVSYGILGDSVAYTVNYLDGDGNALLPSETFYGNVGDKPVIAYQYIEGWLPQAYNLTRTLSDNAAENVFDFVYTRVAATTPQTGGTGTGGGTTAGGTTAGGTGGGAGGAAAGGAAAGGAAGAGDAGAAGAGDEGAAGGDAGAAGDAGAGAGDTVDIGDEAAPQGEAPEDLVDLDEQDTPLANFADGIKNILNPEGNGLLVKTVRPVAGVGLAALLLGCFFFLYKRRKKEKEETESNG